MRGAGGSSGGARRGAACRAPSPAGSSGGGTGVRLGCPRGFTLLEVMASLAILGMGILMVIQLFSGGLGLARAARDQTEAVLLAREKISEALASAHLTAGVTRGEAPGGLRWELRVAPYETDLRAANPALSIMSVEVSVRGGRDGRGGVYRIRTLRTSWKDGG